MRRDKFGEISIVRIVIITSYKHTFRWLCHGMWPNDRTNVERVLGQNISIQFKSSLGEKVTILVDSIGDYVQLLSFHEIIFSYVELIYMCNCAMVQHGVYSSSNWLLLM